MTRQEEIDELMNSVGNGCWPYLIGEKEWPTVKENYAQKEVEEVVITTRDIKRIPDRDKPEPDPIEEEE